MVNEDKTYKYMLFCDKCLRKSRSRVESMPCAFKCGGTMTLGPFQKPEADKRESSGGA